MFGIIRPCRHRLPGDLRAAWLGHLCGLCLALRDEHGHPARLATNTDGLVVSALLDAQTDGLSLSRRAGPCLLRRLRGADVAAGHGPRLAAAVSLALAAARVRDHADDGDGRFRHRLAAAGGRRLADHWAGGARRTGLAVGFDTAVLAEAAARQRGLEAGAGPGTPLTAVTAPTETAVALAFGHTAVLAGRPANVPPLREVGRAFGRIAHLLDAVEDVDRDRRSGAWNPLTATGARPDDARRLCRDALGGLRRSLGRAELPHGRLVRALLVHEVDHAVRRTFGVAAGCPVPVRARATPPDTAPPPPPPPPRGYDPGPVGTTAPPRDRRGGGGGDGDGDGFCCCDCGDAGCCGQAECCAGCECPDCSS
ncbi:MAG TPA: DUF5685 family protein [Candidatus Dormibacteraeota bacterium]|nr:DUF5685 family protein [Candidatus Dormibacteraeota bacterium]